MYQKLTLVLSQRGRYVRKTIKMTPSSQFHHHRLTATVHNLNHNCTTCKQQTFSRQSSHATQSTQSTITHVSERGIIVSHTQRSSIYSTDLPLFHSNFCNTRIHHTVHSCSKKSSDVIPTTQLSTQNKYISGRSADDDGHKN